MANFNPHATANMDYELGYIDQLSGEVIKTTTLTSEIDSEICSKVNEECKRISSVMLHSKLPEEEFKVMVQRHQQSVYLLLNNISKAREEITYRKGQSTARKTLLYQFSAALEQLMSTIREYFPNHIDPSHPLSLPELKTVADQLSQNMDDIYGMQPALSENALFGILKSTISYANLSKINTSRAQADYLIKLLQNLQAVCEHSLDHNSERFKNTLIEQGFNAPEFYNYCCVEIIKKRDDCQDLSESYKEMLWIKKRVEQLVPYKGKHFYKNLPEIKKSLLRFIQAEISHLDNLKKIAKELSADGSLQDDFKVSLSVKELAFFIHLQAECGIIMENKPKKIHEYVVGHYSTKETEKISQKSFKNAYYSHSRDDISKVTNKLAEMLARAQQQS